MINLKITLNFRGDDSPVFLVKMRNSLGEWWLVDAGRWSDHYRDGFVFTDRRDAEAALSLCEQRLCEWHGNQRHMPLGTRLSVIPFKKGS